MKYAGSLQLLLLNLNSFVCILECMYLCAVNWNEMQPTPVQQGGLLTNSRTASVFIKRRELQVEMK